MCSLILRSWLGQLGSSLLPDGESQLAEIALGLQGCVLREVKHARRSHRRGVTHAKSICHVLVVPCPTGRDHGQANSLDWGFARSRRGSRRGRRGAAPTPLARPRADYGAARGDLAGTRAPGNAAVAPGFIVTELTKELPAELQYQIETTSPLGRFCCDRGDPSRSHLLLASDEASSIAGQVLAVDGGLVMV